ncbi:RNAse (barnase) inhibitor barstar [Serratia fonticola]|uniref:RNAse (Barnase) inhibitor barstar n=1 Tax=Serratia fonticola TaxID=47917 RepID=A0A542BNA7_SERFO|nr:barstar family protein [Serratia fonticola]TQI80076.1 RNAse (barnase) inhibitor barstar [Serratia fonticola]TQI97900.1 RNAse (barnase) inhibitor barstar [Serratia fonticola]TVZ72396.1 RNAse (barnase) inhibitor barstar [Serratia fonticola]
MKKIILDGNKQKTPMDMYRFFSDEFDFGPYFGNNPDALYDFMVPIDAEDKPLIISWSNSDVFKKEYPKEFEQFVSVFNRMDEFVKFDKTIFQFKFS